MPIAPLLKRFVTDELARSPALAELVVSGTLQTLRDTRVAGASANERAPRLQLIEALQRHSPAYQKAFLDTLRAKVIEGLKEQQDGPPTGSLAGGGLQLMDETLVEVDIEISRAMQLIDTTAEWELRELQTFTSTLVGQGHVSAESNPLRPSMYAAALWQAACLTVPSQGQRALLLRTSAAVLALQLKSSFAAACTRLESQGVEPGIYRTVVLPGGPPAGRSASPEAARPGAMAGLLNRMPAEVPGGMAGADAALSRATRTGPQGDISPAFESALQRLEQMLGQPPGALPPTGMAVRTGTGGTGGTGGTDGAGAGAGAPPAAVPSRRMSDHRQSLLASADHVHDRQVIELTARLFEAMFSDPRLPAPFRTVIARLQASALRVALTDPRMLASQRHPVWQFVDRIGDASGAYAHTGDRRLVALLAACQSVADQIAHTPKPDATLYRRGLARVDAFITDQFQAQLREAQPAIDSLERGERRDVLEQHLADRLAEQMAPLRTPPSIRRFVGTTWSRVLAESMLRFGEDKEPTPGYIKAVDELLWSVQLPDHPQSRQRLLSLLPGLLQRLRAGMALISLPPAEQQTVLDDLMTIHTEVLRPGRGDTGHGALSAAEIVQQMRDEVLPDTPSDANGDSVIDLASMETVPAELMTQEPSSADESGRTLDAMQPAAQFRLFLQGRWQRAQLLWHSPQRKTFVFAGDNALRRHSITRRALERLVEAGLVQPHVPKSLTQRAVDLLAKQLAAGT